MKLVNMTCPNCGSKLLVDKTTGECACNSCGGLFLLDDETQHIKYENAEEAGYQFEKGRQKALNEYKKRGTNTTGSTSKKKSKLPVWVWILLWTCFLPFTAIYFVYKSSLPQKWKAVIISIISVLLLIGAVRSSINRSNETSSDALTDTTPAHQSASNILSINDSSFGRDVTLSKYDTKNMWFSVNVASNYEFNIDDVTLISDNPEIASISFDHLQNAGNYVYVNIDALSEGETDVYVVSADGLIESERVHVVVSPVVEIESFTILADDMTLAVGQTARLETAVIPEDAVNTEFTWISSNTEVVSVDGDGIVTGLSAGEATITATSTTGVTAETTITVDDTIRNFSVSVNRSREDSNNIGGDWSYYYSVNDEVISTSYQNSNDFNLRLGDTVALYVKCEESDDNPDIGTSTVTHTVTELDMEEGFSVSMDVYVTENSGRNSGQSAHFIVTFTFSVN